MVSFTQLTIKLNPRIKNKKIAKSLNKGVPSCRNFKVTVQSYLKTPKKRKVVSRNQTEHRIR